MVTNKFLRIFFDTRIKPEEVYERKLMLWAAFRKEGRKTDYYHLFFETEDGRKLNCFFGGGAVLEKLDSINHLTIPSPTPVELVFHSVDGSAKYHDIIFLDLDGLARILQMEYK